MKIRWILTLVFASSLIVPFISPDADARGGRGGGFSRGGAASSGGFSGGAGRANRQAGSAQHQENRQDWNNDNREDRQDHGRDRQDDRQDFIDDERDDNWDHHHNDWDNGDFAAGVVVGGVIVGAAASRSVNQVTYVTTLPCQATAVSVDGVSYYKCSSIWYQRGYAGSQVTYIQVAAPPGF
jgi:hypothetical protein